MANVFDMTCNVILVAMGIAVAYVAPLFVVFDTFHVPSSSMTPTINPGDRGVINKLKLGGRFFNIFAAAEGRSFSISRLPGYGKLERNDIIVFNGTFTESWDSIAMNMRTYYCKRAVAVAGDTLEVRDGRYVVRGYDGILGVSNEQIMMKMQLKRFLDGLSDSCDIPGWMKCSPKDSGKDWTIMDMGPLVIPAKGMKMEMNRENFAIYRKYMEWETGRKLEWSEGVAIDNGRIMKDYTFSENYCFAAGDHTIDSQDSRYWGLVPEKFIVGVKF